MLGIKRWIGRKVCDGSDACQPVMMQSKNCSGTWRFLFFTDPMAPTVFQTDHGNLTAVCNDQTVPIEGILVGDFDGSWPEIFTPKPASQVDLALDVKGWEGDEVLLALRASLDAGESLRHVIYSLDYDATAFEYLGMQVGSKTSTWGWFDNPDNAGVAHGIAHIPPHAEELAESGEVIVFRLRARTANASSTISFSRLKANDLDVVAPEIEISAWESRLCGTHAVAVLAQQQAESLQPVDARRRSRSPKASARCRSSCGSSMFRATPSGRSSRARAAPATTTWCGMARTPRATPPALVCTCCASKPARGRAWRN